MNKNQGIYIFFSWKTATIFIHIKSKDSKKVESQLLLTKLGLTEISDQTSCQQMNTKLCNLHFN